MEEMNNVQVENAATISEIERLEAMFKQITNKAIQNLEQEIEVARAMGDEEAKKVHQIQIGMFRHAQSIFDFARKYARDKRWENDNAAG
jgi:hypothetical protein